MSDKKYVITKDTADLYVMVHKMPEGVDVAPVDEGMPADSAGLTFIPNDNIYKVENCLGYAKTAQTMRKNHLSATARA